MNEEAQIGLDRILAIEPTDLTEGERGFLQARRSYLTEEQRITFGIEEHVDAVSSDASENASKESSRKTKKS